MEHQFLFCQFYNLDPSALVAVYLRHHYVQQSL